MVNDKLKILRVFGWNISFIAVAVIIAELIFGSWLPWKTIDPILLFSQPRNVNISFQTPWGLAKYSRDSYGLRGLGSKIKDVRIVSVGGSTTDQRYIDDKDTWSEVLEGCVSNSHTIEVVNAGVDGQTTFGHIKSLQQWLSKIDNLHPQYLLFYVGVNDWFLKKEKVLQDTSLLKKSQWVHNSALYAAYIHSKNFFNKRKERQPAHTFRSAEIHILSMPPNATDAGVHSILEKQYDMKNANKPKNSFLQFDLNTLALRVQTLIDESHKMESIPIFVSQRTALWGHYQGKIYGRKALSFPQEYKTLSTLSPMTGIDFFNLERVQAEIIKNTCEMSSDECLFIDAGLVPFDMKKDFYDDFHNTPEGSKRLGNFICSELKSLI